MIAVVHVEGEIRRSNGRQSLPGKLPCQEELARVSVKIDSLAAQETVVKKSGDREFVRLTKERMKVFIESGLGGPVPECDAHLVGRVAALHPVFFGNADDFQEGFEWRCGAFTDTDNADIRRFNQRDVETLVCPMRRNQVRSYPAGGSTAQDHDTLHAVIHILTHYCSLPKKTARQALLLGR